MYEFSHRDDIQGLRGVAVILVILYHCGGLIPGGFIGVDVFFVISGYVITGSILRSLSKQKFSFHDFYVRRTKRLLPTLSLVVTITGLLSILLSPFSSLIFTARTGIAAMLFNANHYLWRGVGYFDAAAETNALLHTWSLSVEEQFYFVFPLVVFATWKIMQTPRTVGTTIALLSGFCLAVSLFLTYGNHSLGNQAQSAFFIMLPRAWEFGLGAIIAAFPTKWGSRIGGVLAIIGTVLVIGTSFGIQTETLFPGWVAILPVTGTGLVIMGAPSAEWCRRVLASKLLVRFGDISYSWYLWHWPLIVWAHASFPSIPLAIYGAGILSLPLALLTERYFETPLRYREVVGRFRLTKIFVLCLVGPIAAFLVMTNSQSLTAKVPTVANLISMEREYINIGCSSFNALDYNHKDCVWGNQKGERIVLIGDSNARQHIPALREYAKRYPSVVVASTAPACPFVTGLGILQNGESMTECKKWATRSMETLLASPPSVVIIANSTDGYLTRRRTAFTRNHEMARSFETKAEMYTQALGETIAQLQGVGSKVILVDTVPKFFRDERSAISHAATVGGLCSVAGLVFSPDVCHGSRLLHESDKGWVISKIAADAHSRIRPRPDIQLNFDDELCPERVCKMQDDQQRWLYRDGGHISPHGSRVTFPKFESALQTLGQGD